MIRIHNFEGTGIIILTDVIKWMWEQAQRCNFISPCESGVKKKKKKTQNRSHIRNNKLIISSKEYHQLSAVVHNILKLHAVKENKN